MKERELELSTTGANWQTEAHRLLTAFHTYNKDNTTPSDLGAKAKDKDYNDNEPCGL
jgi:hypothetical protein